MKRPCAARSWAGLLALLLSGSLLPHAAPARDAPLTIARQGSFFIGGHDVHSDTLGRIAPFPTSGTITVDQAYVQYQVPQKAGRAPLVFVHGCCLTSASWQTTPDGRPGWDQIFLRLRHPVYLLEQAWRGRSALDPTAINAVRNGSAPASDLPVATSASHEAAWEIFRFGPTFGVTYPGLRFPIAAQHALWQQMVPNFARSESEVSPTIDAISLLAAKIKGSVIISHSQSGIYPFAAYRAASQHIAAIVAIEPAQCPTDKTDMERMRGLPVLILFGDYIAQSPRWAPRHESCAAFVASAQAMGVKARLIDLPAIGIHGNSHMMMQDNNSEQIARMIDRWLIGHRL